MLKFVPDMDEEANIGKPEDSSSVKPGDDTVGKESAANTTQEGEKDRLQTIQSIASFRIIMNKINR